MESQKLEFGKYKGLTIEEIAKKDYKYLKWIENNQEIKIKHETRENIKDFLKNNEEPKNQEQKVKKVYVKKNKEEISELEIIRLSKMTLSFGKYKTLKLEDVLRSEEGKEYLKWYISNENANEKLKSIIIKLFKHFNILYNENK
jgi:uncharacterized protein (DUF3820 family)